MAGKLIMLPFRVWLGSARLLTRAAGGAAGCAVSLAEQTIGVASPDRSVPSPDRSVASPDRSFDGRAPDARHPSPATAEPGWREESIEEPVSPVEVEHPAPAHSVIAVPPPNEPPDSLDEQLDSPVVEEPVHVSEERELVREEAEPGAEDGAGAQLTVIEPWNGYARMNARDVIERARQASPAELATVRLYEARHRSRQTVLAAVDRQLKLAGGPHRA